MEIVWEQFGESIVERTHGIEIKVAHEFSDHRAVFDEVFLGIMVADEKSTLFKKGSYASKDMTEFFRLSRCHGFDLLQAIQQERRGVGDAGAVVVGFGWGGLAEVGDGLEDGGDHEVGHGSDEAGHDDEDGGHDEGHDALEVLVEFLVVSLGGAAEGLVDFSGLFADGDHVDEERGEGSGADECFGEGSAIADLVDDAVEFGAEAAVLGGVA